MKTTAMTGTEKELFELERSYWQALKDKDTEAAIRLTADPCVVTGPQGVGSYGRDAFRSMMSAQQGYTLDDFQLSDDAEVRMLTDDVAIVAYRVHERLTVAGEPIELDAAESSTWVRRDGRWVCALHSEAISGDPFGRDRGAGGGRAA